jgi:hypothetical protein
MNISQPQIRLLSISQDAGTQLSEPIRVHNFFNIAIQVRAESGSWSGGVILPQYSLSRYRGWQDYDAEHEIRKDMMLLKVDTRTIPYVQLKIATTNSVACVVKVWVWGDRCEPFCPPES